MLIASSALGHENSSQHRESNGIEYSSTPTASMPTAEETEEEDSQGESCYCLSWLQRFVTNCHHGQS